VAKTDNLGGVAGLAEEDVSAAANRRAGAERTKIKYGSAEKKIRRWRRQAEKLKTYEGGEDAQQRMKENSPVENEAERQAAAAA